MDIRSNQRGSTLILMVAIAAVLMGTLIYATSIYFQTTLTSMNRQKYRVISLQILQDFAVLAQKAYSNYKENGGACAPGLTQLPTAASPFCWNTAASGSCVRNPHDGAAGITQFCMSDATADMGVATFRIEPKESNAWTTMLAVYQQTYEQRHEVLTAVELNVLRTIHKIAGNTAQADSQQYLPTAAGVPLSYIPNIACPGGSVQDCKTCGANVDCIELQICPFHGGCGAAPPAPASRWFHQVVGFWPRT